MNVGSILNNDSPPKQDDDKSRSSSTGDIHLRNSIGNILNNEQDSSSTESKSQSPPLAKASHNDSIVSINNEDFDDLKEEKAEEEDVKSDVLKKNEGNDGEDQSSTKTIDELKRLKQLKSKKKPTRYTTPPIWAQEWIPPNQRHLLDNAATAPDSLSTLSDKRLFDNSKTQSIDLECSITGVIPSPSITRTIAEWIFANFRDIAEQNHKYVELELKFGTIIDKRKNLRINLNVATECVYTDHSDIKFDMQVEELAWNDLCKYFQVLETSYQDELRKLGASGRNKPKRKFTTLESDITDTIYHVKDGRNEQPKSIRVSKDNNLNPPRYTAIEKHRISSLYVHVPANMYDLRLSLSLEMPIAETAIEQVMARNVPTLIREKKRNSWTHPPTVSQFDLTLVSIPRETKSKSGKKLIERDQNYEVEIEINTPQVFNAIDKFIKNVDPYRFEELVEIFMNNARVLNNRVTSLAYK